MNHSHSTSERQSATVDDQPNDGERLLETTESGAGLHLRPPELQGENEVQSGVPCLAEGDRAARQGEAIVGSASGPVSAEPEVVLFREEATSDGLCEFIRDSRPDLPQPSANPFELQAHQETVHLRAQRLPAIEHRGPEPARVHRVSKAMRRDRDSESDTGRQGDHRSAETEGAGDQEWSDRQLHHNQSCVRGKPGAEKSVAASSRVRLPGEQDRLPLSEELEAHRMHRMAVGVQIERHQTHRPSVPKPAEWRAERCEGRSAQNHAESEEADLPLGHAGGRGEL